MKSLLSYTNAQGARKQETVEHSEMAWRVVVLLESGSKDFALDELNPKYSCRQRVAVAKSVHGNTKRNLFNR
jgi:hypothetical protein